MPGLPCTVHNGSGGYCRRQLCFTHPWLQPQLPPSASLQSGGQKPGSSTMQRMPDEATPGGVTAYGCLPTGVACSWQQAVIACRRFCKSARHLIQSPDNKHVNAAEVLFADVVLGFDVRTTIVEIDGMRVVVVGRALRRRPHVSGCW